MGEKHYIISYYKNAESEMHVQKINSSKGAQEEHSHDYYQIYYISQGTVKHITENDTSTLIKGDAFIIPPGQKHRISDFEDSVVYTFSFTVKSLEQSYKELLFVMRFLEDISKDGAHARIRLSDNALFTFERLMENIYTEFSQKQIGYVDAMRAYATVILTLLARAHFESTEITIPDTDNRSRILNSIKYMETNYRDELTEIVDG